VGDGAWDRALEITDHAGEHLPELVAAALDAAASYVHAARGDRRPVEWYPRIRQSWRHDGMYAVQSGSAAVEAHGWAGDIAAMLATRTEVVVFLRDLWREGQLGLEVRLAAVAIGHLATVMPSRSTRERVDLLADAERLAAEASRIWGEGSTRRPPTLEGRCWIARLDAELLRARLLAGQEVDGADLIQAWTRAVQLFEERSEPYEVARSLAGLAQALLAAGTGTGEAADAIERARGIATELGAAPLLRRIPTGPVRGPSGPAELTRREQEVLGHLALGRSNGEIGRVLFISTKTVSVHVSRILAKLDVASRGEAVAAARARGLLDP